jgi:hypothetical protein
MKVNGKDDIPYEMENNMFETTNQLGIETTNMGTLGCSINR